VGRSKIAANAIDSTRLAAHSVSTANGASHPPRGDHQRRSRDGDRKLSERHDRDLRRRVAQRPRVRLRDPVGAGEPAGSGSDRVDRDGCHCRQPRGDDDGLRNLHQRRV
jgi:hypothetical protein